MSFKKADVHPDTFFRKAVSCLCDTQDMNLVMEHLLDYLKDIMPVFRIGVFCYDYDSNRMKILAIACIDNMNRIPEYVTLDINPEELFDYMESHFVRPEDIYCVADSDNDPITQKVAEITGEISTSHMATLLVHNGERIGVIGLSCYKENGFTQHHQDLLKLLKAPLSIVFSNALRSQEVASMKEELMAENKELARKLWGRSDGTVIGSETGLKKVMEKLKKVAPLNSSVLIQGETGVGKEVIATMLHSLSSRVNGTFIKIDCGTIPETLIESELFGHEKGAFSGADKQKRGNLEHANGGTVFLDEIGELTLNAQVKLLRLLQNKEIVRVGGTKVISLDVRIVCATHRNLQRMVKEGLFREDLWYRLNVFPIWIPPLRQRKQDLPQLVYFLIKKKAIDMNLLTLPIPNNSQLSELASYDWPGNVRELENIIERWLILDCGSGSFYRLLQPFDTPESENPKETCDIARITRPDDIQLIDSVMKRYITQALSACNTIIAGPEGAAARLGLHPSTLRSRMKKLGIVNPRLQ